jgi:ribosomal protein S10
MDSVRTTKSNGAGSAKFDYEKFSRFLNLHAQEPLLKLLKSIDSRARVEISMYVKR